MSDPDDDLGPVPLAIRQALDALTTAETRMHALPAVVIAARRRAAVEKSPQAREALEAAMAQMRAAMEREP